MSVMLAKTWNEAWDPTGWWLTEKLDGVRAFWDGRRMWTRNGREIAVPAAERAELPDVALDGELWIDRGRFQEVAAIVRKHDPTPADWAEVCYMCFDAPLCDAPFEGRQHYLQRHLEGSQFAAPLPQGECAGGRALAEYLDRLQDCGGEGAILRRPRSPYEPARSRHMYKLKRFQDTDAIVIGYLEGTGRNAGRISSLRVREGDYEYTVGGLGDSDRAAPPSVGAKVIVQHMGRTARGVPRHPTFVGQRAD